MPPLALLGLQIVASFGLLGLLAIFVVAPVLDALPRERALIPLLWTHAPRYVALALLAPGQTAPEVSSAVLHTIAWGDFISAGLAMMALTALHRGSARAVAWVWAFSAVSVLDIVLALTTALSSGIVQHPLGAGWYVLTLYVPLVCVSQALILGILTRRLQGA